VLRLVDELGFEGVDAGELGARRLQQAAEENRDGRDAIGCMRLVEIGVSLQSARPAQASRSFR
jgi:hypothetical protein